MIRGEVWEIAQSIILNRLSHVAAVDQSERANYSGKYVLCSDIFPTLSSDLTQEFGVNHRTWIRRGRVMREDEPWTCFIAFFVRSATCSI